MRKKKENFFKEICFISFLLIKKASNNRIIGQTETMQNIKNQQLKLGGNLKKNSNFLFKNVKFLF